MFVPRPMVAGREAMRSLYEAPIGALTRRCQDGSSDHAPTIGTVPNESGI